VKVWWKSRTVWVNTAAILALVVDPSFTTNPVVLKWGGLALAVINVFLRTQTSTALGSPPK
jgi:hypothetical protein